MMRKLLFVAASLLFMQANYAQCVTEAFLDVDTIDCGDSVNVTINSFARSLLTEVFTPTGPSDPGWFQTAGAIYTNPFIPSPTNDTYFWMGSTSILPALLQSDPFNVQFGGQICFDFVYAIQGGISPTEGPDESQEGITLQYSIDNGLTWNDIVYMQPNGEFLPSNPGPGNPMTNPPFDDTGTPFTTWNSVCFPLPPGALTSATSFQWIQEFNSGPDYDHWGLDNIQILAADPAYGLFDEAGNFLPSNQFALSPIADSTYSFLYTNGIDDSCTTTATVTLNPTDAGPDIMVACDGIGTNLMANGVAPWSSVTWSPATGLTDPTDPNTFALPLVDTDYELTSDCGVDTVTVFVEDSYDINITPPDTICLNGSTFLNLTTSPSSVPIASVEWSSPGTLNSPTGNQVLASPTVTTQYIATVTSDSGCIIQDSVTLVVQGFASAIEVTPSDPSVCIGSSVNLTADIVANPSPYTLIQGTYNPYPTMGGTAITGLADENTVGPFNIGFTFPFFGNFYNSFWLSSNGFMTFTSPSGSFFVNENIPNGAQPNNIIAWAWDDLDFSAGGTVNYYVGGTAPNQYMVINFLNVPHFVFFGPPVSEVSVQVVIYQSGLIEINNINVVPDDIFGTMTQGIENANGSQGVAEQTFNNTNFISIAENYSFVPISGPVNPVYTWSPPLYLNDTTGQTVTATPEGHIEYFVTMVDGICSSTTSVFVNVDSLVFLGDLDYFLECPEDSFQFNVQFETNIFNDISNGPCTLGGSGVFTLGQVGAGTASTGAPTPYEGLWEDGRMQVIYTAAELNAAGFTGGELESIAFNVTNKASSAPYNNFTVRVQPTTLTTLTNFINTGFTTVVNPYAHTTALGWNWHVFDNSFCWDGVTDLLFEVCFDNADWTSDDDVEYTNSTSNQVVYDFTDGAAGCTLPNATASNQKPNLQFNYENLVGGLAPIVAQWSPSAAFVNDTVENPILILADTTAQYPVTIAAGNCVNTDTVTVSFGAGYTLTNDTAVCEGESVQLNANGGSNHVWTPDNGTLTSTTIPNPVATPTGTTDYIVSLDLTNCSIQDTVTITVNPLPVSTINGGVAEEVVLDGSMISLVSTADSNWNNEWTGPETGTGVSIDPTTEGIYVLTSTDTNGCVSSSSIVVSFYYNPKMPDAFTPNGDNLNDVLFPVNMDPATTITAFKVFNRWGDVVYEYNGDNGWDGTFESEKQPADVYNYYLVINKAASEFVLSGSVTLIR